MLLGRLEIDTVFVLLCHSFWKKQRSPHSRVDAMAELIRLQYHAQALRLLGCEPRVSADAVRAIEQCEAACGVRLPAVRTSPARSTNRNP
jgi:hypothetical protein